MDEYVDLSTEQGKKNFKKEVSIEKYDKPTTREILRNAKEGFIKEKAKAKAFYEDKLQNKVEGTKTFLKKNLSNMKENKRKGVKPFGTRKMPKEESVRSTGGVFNMGTGRPFDSGRSSGGVMNSQGRNVFSGGSSGSGGVFASGKVVQAKKKQGKTIVIRL